jgi:FKBP-type peptidyl-prolyl cis-trans isomerase
MKSALCALWLVALPFSFATEADDRLKAGSLEFLADIDKQSNVTILKSGLRYTVLKEGASGSPGKMPKTDTKCKVSYTGFYPQYVKVRS